MTSPCVAMVAADTTRARAYANAIARAGLGPLHGIFYGPPVQAPERPLPGEGEMIGDLWIPKISPSLREIFSESGWPVTETGAESVNANECVAALRQVTPALVIFAGRGGEIVSRQVLEIGVPFLHVHAGALPEQRGSTTIYYSIIDRRRCAATAILLAPEIDTGPVVACAEYPLPPSSIDIDLLYDNSIRADLLVKTLRSYRAGDAFDSVRHAESRGRTYYVIHPVLKHLAILSLATTGEMKPETE